MPSPPQSECTTYSTLPEDFLDYLYSFKSNDSQTYANILALSAAGWKWKYLEQFISPTPNILRAYKGQDLSEKNFKLPEVPHPSLDSPHIIKLRSIYSDKSLKTHSLDMPLLDLTEEQREPLAEKYDKFSEYMFYQPSDPDTYKTSPKFQALADLAPDLLFYYSLGVSSTKLAIYMTRNPNANNNCVYRVLKGYYQWLTPFSRPRNPTSFSLIYSPQISRMTTSLLSKLDPSPKNLESLSQTPHCTRFGPDLTLQKHLFRRKSYQTLFTDIPQTATLLGPQKEPLTLSDVQDLVDADLV